MGRAKNLVRSGPVHERSLEYWQNLSSRVVEKSKELGFGPAAVAEPGSQRVEKYERWIQAGMHGEMGFMARDDRIDRRRDMSLILPDVKAVVVCGLIYWPGKAALEPPTDRSVVRGETSCYAWGKDYHAIFEDRLRALAHWMHAEAGGVGRWYVDTGAILERDMAEKAGLGFIGKNTMLINPRYGSGLFLGEVLTTLPLVSQSPPRMPGCGKCTKCQVACPTDAFDEEYVLDARKCISYLTIELKGDIPVELRPMMGTKIYGCDICQQVCPWNKFEWEGDLRGRSPLFGNPSIDVKTPDLLSLMRMSDAEFRSRFAGTAVLRIGRERLRRNVAVALGNCGDPRALPALQEALGDESQLVQRHAQWAIDHLRSELAKRCTNSHS